MSKHSNTGQTHGSCQFLKEKELSRGKWLSLNEVTYKDPDGKERTWEAVYRTTNTSNDADAVVIIPILKRALRYDCVILVKQYRPPIKAYTLEFPAGLIDEGETFTDSAVRELREETGYTCSVKHISPATSLDPGIGNTSARMVTVEIDGDEEINRSPQPKLDETEFIDVLIVPLDEMLSLLNELSACGVIIDSRVYTYAIAMEQTRKIK